MTDYDSNGGTPSHAALHPDYSTPLTDEYGFMHGDAPDTIPWCPEEDVAGVLPMHGAGMDSIIPKAHRLPEVAYGSFELFATNGTGVAQSVGFPINAVIVSNWTPQWARILGCWIPPYAVNGVLKIPSSTKQAEVIWEAPTGFTQPTSLSGAQLRAVFCEEPLAVSPFTTIPLAAATTNITSGFANVQATTTTTLVTIPAGGTWVGTVGLSAATSVAAGGSAATVVSSINIDQDAGTSVPADGVYARVDITIPADGAALSPVAQSVAIDGQPLTVTAGTSTCLIEHIATISNGTSPQASGWAIGQLL